MKKIVMALALFSVFACQESKIGFVDNQKLMEEYQEKIDVEAKFKVKIDALTQQRDSISQMFQMKLQAFQAKAQKMPQAQAQEEYGLLQQEGQFMGQQLQKQEQELQVQSQTEMDSIVSKVKREVKAYGKDNGYTFILGGGDGGSVLYGAEAQEVTAPIVKALNDKYKN
ncbi:OmpH family outer membrane protein [Cellulophaga baltica]|uniref:OmpH family outer membrane protein n=1 Tax=Cellulophaga baltica TaxID=76594 RepID=UPI0004670ACE|nr:OmpH family outer membrane protein [Cellulophaga baltica]